MSENLEDKDKLNYAWNWFSYHANQRLVCFNFFLVVLGGVGYLLFSHPEDLVFLIVGIFLVWVTNLFWILEVRNRELVNCGREVLDEIIKDEKINPRIKDDKRSLLEKTLKEDRFLPRRIRLFPEDEITHTYVYDQVYKWTGIIGWVSIIVGIAILLKIHWSEIILFVCGNFRCK